MSFNTDFIKSRFDFGCFEKISKDIIPQILFTSDLPSILALASLNSAWKLLIDNHFIWQKFGKIIGLKNPSSCLKEYQIFFRSIIRVTDQFNGPQLNAKIVGPNKTLSFENILTLSEYCKAKNVLTFWWELAKSIEDTAFISFYYNVAPTLNLEDILNKAKGFRFWCEENKKNLMKVLILELESCSLTSLPPEIGYLTNLKSLYLKNNLLTLLPPEIGLLTNLEVLDLKNNLLTSLPSEIGQLTKLKRLNLRVNFLTSLPSEIEGLTSLKFLILSHNSLTSLPPEIGKLIELKDLSLTYNSLTSIPKEIAQLSKLTSLNLWYNLLTSIPFEFWQLEKLSIWAEEYLLASLCKKPY